MSRRDDGRQRRELQMRRGDLRLGAARSPRMRPHRQQRRAHQQHERAEPKLMRLLQNCSSPTPSSSCGGGGPRAQRRLNALATKRLCRATNARALAFNARLA